MKPPPVTKLIPINELVSLRHKHTKSGWQKLESRTDETEAGGLCKLIAKSDVSTCRVHAQNE